MARVIVLSSFYKHVKSGLSVIDIPMHRGLLWKLCVTIGAGTVMLFWAIDILTQRTEQNMSFIAQQHQQQIRGWGQEAESIYNAGGKAQLQPWLNDLQQREQTWASVVKSDVKAIAGGDLSESFSQGFWLGRDVAWKIHLYFNYNPVMEVPFSDGHRHFLIRLPQRMRPGAYLAYTHVLLQIALPLLLLTILSWVLYRHVMTPLRKLELATRQFSDGQLDVRVRAMLGSRNDELTALADTFDHMAERTGKLIITQRQLLADLSHELRTPLARIDMAVDCVEQGIKPEQSLQRLRYEAQTMRQLVEDALTLAWLTTEEPTLDQEAVDVVELLQLIVDDARFEYPDRIIETRFPLQAIVRHSSHRALTQAFENIIRNALKHTPAGCGVQIGIERCGEHWRIVVQDSGNGVPEPMLQDIFKPFFRVEKSRTDVVESVQSCESARSGGYGLGLALAQRQLLAVGGSVAAKNCRDDTGNCMGLQMQILLPGEKLQRLQM